MSAGSPAWSRGRHPAGDQCQRQVSLSRGGAAEQAGQLQFAHHGDHRRNVAVRERSLYLQGFPGPPHDGAALQQHAQAVDQSRRQLPEIGDRALPNAFAFAITLAKEHRRRGTTIRDHVDEHGLTESQSESCRKRRVWTRSERREKHKSPIPSRLSCSPKRKLRTRPATLAFSGRS
jgi:hypothetical protein